MGSSKEATRRATKQSGRRKQSDNQDHGQETTRFSSSVRLFLIAFELPDLATPRFEMEFGPDGPTEPVYLRQISHLLRDESRNFKGNVENTKQLLLLEGYGKFSPPGFSDQWTVSLRTSIQFLLYQILIKERVLTGSYFFGNDVGGLGEDAKISVLWRDMSAVDKYCQLWKAQAADSSSEMWNQLLVPDFRPEEESHMNTSSSEGGPDLESVLSLIAALNDDLTRAQQPLQQMFQQLLSRLEGRSFGSLEANTSVADAIRELMLRLEVRVECPRDDCHEPSLIRCRPAGRTLHGSFGFEHRLKGKHSTHSALTQLPVLKLVPAPPHRMRKKSK